MEAILASAAIPTLFPAVEINGHRYWDGLFSDNPPVKELIRAIFVGGENVPDEIWVIQIDPTTVESLPKTNSQIFDRRNQMEGNVSLMQSLDFVEFCNLLLREKGLTLMSSRNTVSQDENPSTSDSSICRPNCSPLSDYVSKLSREPPHIHRLIEDGEKQGREFLESLASESPVA